MPAPAPLVAIINSSDDVVNLLREFFEEEAYRTAVAHVPEIKRGDQDLLDFLDTHDPGVIIYDISPPYEQNWTFFRLIQNLRAMERRGLIITTTNREALKAVSGTTDALELIGKPYDLNEILQAVRRGQRRRAPRRPRAAAGT